MTNLELITSEILETLKRKNENYGNSFDRQMNVYGILAATIRLDDKMSRLRALTKGEPDKVGESIEDTLKDMIGYCLLTLNWLAEDKDEDGFADYNDSSGEFNLVYTAKNQEEFRKLFQK
ncbi:nucleotide modification associated domain-containing protein [Listeria aquatica]|uniref:nucleotide modification associated domain-containing protein n=1 Tax=Listeria aquatica TaxID=1494960 RepID=UPI003EF6C9AC